MRHHTLPARVPPDLQVPSAACRREDPGLRSAPCASGRGSSPEDLRRRTPRPPRRGTDLDIAARSRHPEVKAPVHLVYGEKDWSRPWTAKPTGSCCRPADFTQVPKAETFIALKRPDVLADLLNAVA
jgi:pimeloyl-ACP methyl ester carboxylesterase